MAPLLLPRLREWIRCRIERQIAALSTLNTLTVGILLSLVSFSTSLWILNDETRNTLEHRLDRAAARLESKLDTLLASIRDLAANPVTTMALLDSKGRDAYLVPFLNNYRFPLADPHSVMLCDYNGEVLGEQRAQSLGCLRNLPEAKSVLSEEKRQIAIRTLRQKPYLVVFEPVLFPGTGRAEGYVATALDLEAAMADPSLTSKNTRLILTSAARDIRIEVASPEKLHGTQPISATQPVFRNNPALAGFELALEMPRRLPDGFFTLILGHAAAILAMVGLAIMLSVRRARILAAPLRKLNEAARRIAAGDAMVGPLVETNRRDEIGELAASLNDMVATLARARETLDAQVEERTAELQEALARAESASRVKTEFLANMSHEVRTPMNAVIGLSELAASRAADPELKDYLAKIGQSAKSLLGLLNDILDYSRMDAGRLEIAQAPFDIGKVVEELRSAFSPAAEGKGLAFEMAIAPDVPRHLVGDALRVGQVLSNLVGNAIKFTDRGTVRIDIARIGEDAGCVRLRLSVRDTGIGIPPETAGRILEPFVQADGSMTRRFGGMGLGLAITQRLVALMGGTLEMQSRPGEGSAFVVELPCATASAPEGAFLDSPVPGFDAKRLEQIAGDDAGLMKSLLESFIEDNRNAAERIGAMLSEGRLDEAQREAHSLKGIAGNLGATTLAAAAAALNVELREGRPPEAWPDTRAALEAALAGARAFIDRQGNPPAGSC